MTSVTCGTLPEHLSSPPVFNGFMLLDLWFFCVVFCICLGIICCPFVFFLLVIVLSVFLRFMDSDYPFNLVSSNSFSKATKRSTVLEACLFPKHVTHFGPRSMVVALTKASSYNIPTRSQMYQIKLGCNKQQY